MPPVKKYRPRPMKKLLTYEDYIKRADSETQSIYREHKESVAMYKYKMPNSIKSVFISQHYAK